MSGTAHSYEWHDLVICVTWLIHMCDMAHSYVWHGVFICVIWIIHMCDTPHSHVWHDSFTYAIWPVYVRAVACWSRVTWHIHMCDMTHSQLRQKPYDFKQYLRIERISCMSLLRITNDDDYFMNVTCRWLYYKCEEGIPNVKRAFRIPNVKRAFRMWREHFECEEGISNVKRAFRMRRGHFECEEGISKCSGAFRECTMNVNRSFHIHFIPQSLLSSCVKCFTHECFTHEGISHMTSNESIINGETFMIEWWDIEWRDIHDIIIIPSWCNLCECLIHDIIFGTCKKQYPRIQGGKDP